MSVSLAKGIYSAFANEKPHSSITEWVEILTSDKYGGEAYEGIPELVDSIKLQGTGPAEASRAIRKKLKHGNAHQQYRALVLLKALVENCGPRFQSSFADSQLTDAIKQLSSDSATDEHVKKKLTAVLASWHAQFKDDPGMSYVANLYKPPRPRSMQPDPAEERRKREEAERKRREEAEEARRRAKDDAEEARRRAKDDAEDAKRRAKEEREEKERDRWRKADEDRAAKKAAKDKDKNKAQPARRRFNYEQEKPNILASIATASQCSSNLVNAITLVNTENDSLTSNARVQECLNAAKDARKKVVRYVQLVENEELMGTLIETNERIIAALEMYDTLSKPIVTEKDVEDVQKDLARAKIHDSELGKLQQKQRAAVQRAIVRQDSNTAVRSPSANTRGKERAYSPDAAPKSRAYGDLHDLDFSSGGATGGGTSGLQAPLRPNANYNDNDYARRGSLSDFSDYESSDEESRNARARSASRGGAGGSRSAYASGWDTGSRSASKARAYAGLPEEDEPVRRKSQQRPDPEDPFADPFAD